MVKQSISTTEIEHLTNVRSASKPKTLLSIPAITSEALRVLNEELIKANEPQYEIRQKYGKYQVVKYYGRDYSNSEILIKGLTKEVAEGYIKLLKEK